ncbi:ABC transporter, permease protein, partial [Shigella flexneri K-671]
MTSRSRQAAYSMILPVQAALERLPPSLLQASADLGARPR